MLLKTLSDIFAIEGKVASNIRDNRPSLTSSLLVLIAGFIYGLAIFYFKSEDLVGELNYYYLVFIIIFGFLYMVASQIGITLLLWAMCRFFKGTPRLMPLFSAVGYSFLPYGVLVAVLTYYNNTTVFNKSLFAAVVLACLVLLIYYLTKVIHLMEGFSRRKAFVCVSFCLIFFGSFIYIFGY